MPRQAWSVHAVLSRGRAWFHRLVDDQAYDEWEADTEPATLDDDTRGPQALIDEVLSEAAGDRAPLADGGVGRAEPNPA